MIYRRRTLAREVALDGYGLHSGERVRVCLHPSESGIRFIAGGETVEARPEHVIDTSRCTRLRNVSTIEHLMSALAGMEVTDVDVEVGGPEMPALDGASRMYVDALKSAGFVDLGDACKRKPFSRIFTQDPSGKVAISVGTGHWRYDFETGTRWPGEMQFERLDVVESFEQDIAPARTFGFEEELPMIRTAGLAKGLNETNALVLGQMGYLNAAKFEDEPPRHKLLDLIGDLYLSGVPIRQLNVVAARSGHKLHIQAAKLLAQASA